MTTLFNIEPYGKINKKKKKFLETRHLIEPKLYMNNQVSNAYSAFDSSVEIEINKKKFTPIFIRQEFERQYSQACNDPSVADDINKSGLHGCHK
jgi:hypothetical protein